MCYVEPMLPTDDGLLSYLSPVATLKDPGEAALLSVVDFSWSVTVVDMSSTQEDTTLIQEVMTSTLQDTTDAKSRKIRVSTMVGYGPIHRSNHAIIRTCVETPSREKLRWPHNERDGVSNHRCLDCLLSRLFRQRWKKRSKLRVIGFCEGNSAVTAGFPSQRASNAENISITSSWSFSCGCLAAVGAVPKLHCYSHCGEP